MHLLENLIREPVETLVETLTVRGDGALDTPPTITESTHAELVGDLGGIHGIREILFVREYQEGSIPQVLLIEHALQLLSRLADTVPVVGIHDEDEALSVGEVVSPERTDLQDNGERSGETDDGEHIYVCALRSVIAPENGKLQLTLSWPPTSQTVKLMFLYSTVSTLKPAGVEGSGNGGTVRTRVEARRGGMDSSVGPRKNKIRRSHNNLNLIRYFRKTERFSKPSGCLGTVL